MRLRTALLAAMVVLLGVSPVNAQVAARPPQITRADLQGQIGWLNLNKPDLDRYDNWINRLAFGGASFGWYWTDNLKTTIEGGVSTSAEWYAYQEVVIDGLRGLLNSELQIQNRSLAIGQQYQFYRNVWFHPFVGGSVDLTWERTEREDEQILGFDARTGQPRVLQAAMEHQRQTDLLAHPCLSFGFKGYFTPRQFISSDARIVIGDRIERVMFRFGVGLDF
jgi:hypothetical protein